MAYKLQMIVHNSPVFMYLCVCAYSTAYWQGIKNYNI